MRHLFTAAAGLALTGCAVANTVANVGRAPRFSKPSEVPAPALEQSIASSGRSDSSPPARGRGLRGGASGPALESNPATNDNVASSLRSPPPPTPSQEWEGESASSPSLFRPGAAGLFRDNRAYGRGDILIVRVAVNDRASLANATSRNRSGSESASLASLLGLDKLIDRVLPGKAPSASVGGNSKSGSTGSGSVDRAETINLTLSAVVTDVAPNGNLVIRARQEIRVNNELRELAITGLIRPQDIARDNSVQHTQIAEARVLYGGRGQLTSAQQARWGQQIFDALFPF